MVVEGHRPLGEAVEMWGGDRSPAIAAHGMPVREN